MKDPKAQAMKPPTSGRAKPATNGSPTADGCGRPHQLGANLADAEFLIQFWNKVIDIRWRVSDRLVVFASGQQFSRSNYLVESV